MRINDWVSSSTNGNIIDLLSPESITDLTQLVLTNAIYFKGEWLEPFDVERTKNGPFTTLDNQTIQAPMMHATQRYSYNEDDQVQVLFMEYKKSSLMMAIILPKNKQHFQKILQSFDAAQWSKLQPTYGEFSDADIYVTLPKFKLDANLSETLIASLKNLGLTDAFDAGKANFNNMAKPQQGGSLYINNIIQKAIIEVDEAGTVAAAATGMISIPGGKLQPKEPRKIYFTADHPFLYILYDQETKMILFMGNVSKM